MTKIFRMQLHLPAKLLIRASPLNVVLNILGHLVNSVRETESFDNLFSQPCRSVQNKVSQIRERLMPSPLIELNNI
jgi:hypothetical protein